MPDFIRKISSKNVFIIIKTCSASGGSAPYPRNVSEGRGALPLSSHQGLCRWTPLGDFRPSPGFPVPPDRRGLEGTLHVGWHFRRNSRTTQPAQIFNHRDACTGVCSTDDAIGIHTRFKEQTDDGHMIFFYIVPVVGLLKRASRPTSQATAGANVGCSSVHQLRHLEFCNTNYTASQKTGHSIILPITSANVGQFSNFFFQRRTAAVIS